MSSKHVIVTLPLYRYTIRWAGLRNIPKFAMAIIVFRIVRGGSLYTLKEFINDYYKTRGTAEYVTFLDASKAFDRIDQGLLFDKVIKKGVPLFIIKLLVFWYSRQRMFVRWGNILCSTSFCVTNGVKQGGIISPMLFNLYMDDLGVHVKLSCSVIGGYIGSSFINHLCYVDDLCLISLSSSGMQHLLKADQLDS